MDVILNTLPTRTWNWLKMNGSTVKIEGSFAPYTPEATLPAEKITWVKDAQWTRSPSSYGFHPDFTELTKDAGTDLLETDEDQIMTKPVILTYTYKNNTNNASRLVLHAQKGSRMEVIILLRSEEKDCTGSSALQVEVCADESSTVNLYSAQLAGSESLLLNELGGYTKQDAKVNLVRLELGGKSAYTGASIDLAGDESTFRTMTGYHAGSGQLLDMNYVALHHGKHTESYMEVNGTVEEHAKKIFRGTIDFQQGCKGAKGTENENVLLFGEKMVNQTIPLILCKEEDVEGNHGASIGQLDDKLLFYLGSRGITPEEAQQMISQARIRTVCDTFPDKNVRGIIEKFEGMEETDDEK